MYTFENLIDDVKKEAAALKVHATKEELGKLTLSILDPNSEEECYYGLMTGNCYSQRAAHLIQLCTPKYFGGEIFELADSGVDGVSRLECAPAVADFVRSRSTCSAPKIHYSAIEAYILLPEAKNANLIAYLKSETETLEL